MIHERDLVKGNYFLDSGYKLLRVDSLDEGYDNNSNKTIKIEMHNWCECEPHPLMAPDGKFWGHPYTEYLSGLNVIPLSCFDEYKVGDIFKDFTDDVISSVLVDVKIDKWTYMDTFYTCTFHNVLSTNKVTLNSKEVSLDILQGIVYSMSMGKIILELQDSFILKKVKDGKLII